MDSNPNATPHELKTGVWVLRFVLAILLGFGIAVFIGATAWSGTQGLYTSSEIRAIQTSAEVQVNDIRDQEITQLRITLGRRVPGNRRADLYFRLAELYLEAYRATFLLEGRVHEKRLELGQQESFIDRSHSKPFLSLGIHACHEILKLKIPYSKQDQLYYFLGFNYGELGDRKESIRYFETLIKKYPDSAFAYEAYRELGDIAFESNQFRKALSYYEMAIKNNTASDFPRTLHKLAWTYYRTRQHDRAVSTMKEAIARATQSGEKFLSLKEESLRDMAIFMTETGRVEEAIAYFASVAGDKSFYPKALEKLGRQYERNVEPEKAKQVYEALLRAQPSNESAFRIRVKLVDLDLRRGRYRDALERLKGPLPISSGDVEIQTTLQNLRAMIRRTATEHHAAFRKESSHADLEIAEEYYSAYLNIFLTKDDPRKEIPEIWMYLAEVKRDMGKSKEASELYRKILDSKDKRYAKEAGALWIASLADSIRKASQKAQKSSATEPSAQEKEFIEAADELQEILGETPEAREAILRSAQILAGYKNTQKAAIKKAKKVIALWPKSSQALTAARLWIQVLADQDATDELRDAMKEIRSNSSLISADQTTGANKLAQAMTDQDNRLRVGAIARLEHEKDFSSAAKGYESYAADSNKQDVAERAYANSIFAYIKADHSESVDRVTTTWIKRFPKSKKAMDSIRSAGTRVLIQGKFELAGKLFEKLGKTGNDADSLETAALLHDGNGNAVHAQKDYADYLALYKDSTKRWKISLLLAESQEGMHRESEAAQSYRYCMSGPAELEAECGTRLADLYYRSKDLVQAKSLFRKIAEQNKRKHKSFASLSPYVGYARYRLAEMMELGAKFDPLRLPETSLKKAIGQRLEFLEALNRVYISAVEVGGVWGVASLDRLAKWVIKLSDEIDHIAPPEKADAATVAKFRKNLATVSEPLRKKAANIWSDAYTKAIHSEIFSPVLPEIADRLSEMKLSSQPRAQGARGRFRLAGISVDGGSDGHSNALEKVRAKLLKDSQDSTAWVDYGNLLWGELKPGLAKIAYERALILDPKNTNAMNNLAVIAMSGSGEEDWVLADEANSLLKNALEKDDFFLPAKMNRALLLNYYRIFSLAKPLWEQVLSKADVPDVYSGFAIALQGLGDVDRSEVNFLKSGVASAGFVRIYHEAAKQVVRGRAGTERCLEWLREVDETTIGGFEKDSIDRLKRVCQSWKN